MEENGDIVDDDGHGGASAESVVDGRSHRSLTQKPQRDRRSVLKTEVVGIFGGVVLMQKLDAEERK